MNVSKLRLMVVAGEPSGDAHSASLVTALREAAPHTQIQFFGATGPLMRAAGVETVVNSDELAIMGILEVGRVFSKFLRAFRQLKRAALEKKPDAIILVDWPEFNLRLAKTLHRQGMRTVYYISPQVWAWRSYRVKQIKRDIDLLLSILPFERDWFDQRDMSHVEYVGHPLSGEVRAHYDREEFCRKYELDSNLPLVALLPGSRHKELVRILPPMLAAADLMAKQRADLQFVLVVAPSRSLPEAELVISQSQSALPQTLRLVHHETREALAASDAAAVASGTATLEAALLNTPMVIVYKESPVNWHTLGRLITADHYGLVNLVAGERVVTELMQNELTAEGLAKELFALLDEERNKEMRVRLHEISAQLGEGGASRRAAERIIQFLETPNQRVNDPS